MSECSVTVYVAPNGWVVTRWQLDRKLETGTWQFCLRDLDRDRWLVEIDDGSCLLLVRTPVTALPAWLEVHSDGTIARVVDTRRTRPR